MSKEFVFKIGDVVALSLHVDEVRRFQDATQERIRPMSMRVLERVSVECVGGVQLFYSCQGMDGSLIKSIAEDGLVNADVLWDAWLEGMHKQDARKKVQP